VYDLDHDGIPGEPGERETDLADCVIRGLLLLQMPGIRWQHVTGGTYASRLSRASTSDLILWVHTNASVVPPTRNRVEALHHHQAGAVSMRFVDALRLATVRTMDGWGFRAVPVRPGERGFVLLDTAPPCVVVECGFPAAPGWEAWSPAMVAATIAQAVWALR
jgi:hypothetical protein